MLWDEFKRRKNAYSQIWKQLKDEFTGDAREFLNRSYLVVTYGFRQIPFETDDLSSIAIDYSDFFMYDKHSEALIKLVREYKMLKKRFQCKA